MLNIVVQIILSQQSLPFFIQYQSLFFCFSLQLLQDMCIHKLLTYMYVINLYVDQYQS